MRIIFAMLVICSPPSLAAAQSREVEYCLQRTNASDQQAFLEFDREVRAALRANDPVRLALLASYPVRVNDDYKTMLIDDARTLAARAAMLFPDALRARVAATSIDDLICRPEGIGYGGDIWVSAVKRFGAERFFIDVINLPDDPTIKPGPVAFVCRADDHRVVVTRTVAGELQYRAWRRPRSLLDRPDMELGKGTVDIEGTGLCARRVWTFTNHKTVYEVGEIGCVEGDPPNGAEGELRVIVDEVVKMKSWCF